MMRWHRLLGRLREVDRWSVVLVLAPVVPVVVAIVRMLVERRVPLGDNGLIALRSHDVLTADHPWFGSWSSASLSAGVDVNNPSPLQFDVLALFVKPFGVTVGAVMGAGFLNIAAIVVAIRQGRRAAGRHGEVVFAIGAAGLSWSLGSEMLVDVWQPHNMVLPFLAFLACSAAVAAGRWSSLAWAVGVGSFVVGAHLSFVYVTVVVLGAAIGWSLLSQRPQHGERRSVNLDRRRNVTTAAVVAVLCWAQPLVEQFFLAGRGNLSRVAEASGSDAKVLGVRLGTRLAAQVLALPPWWLRPSFTDSIRFAPFAADGSVDPSGVVRLPFAVLALLALAVLLVVTLRAARRRGDAGASALGVVSAAGVVGAVVTLVIMPIGVIGLAPHQMRWLWPVCAVLTVWLAGEVFRAVGPRLLPAVLRRDHQRLALGVVVVVALSSANLPRHDSDLGPAVTRASNGAVRSVMAQVSDVVLPGPTVFDDSTLSFAEPYSGAVLAALVEADQPIRAGTASFTRQLGDRRRPRGDERWAMQIREGEGAAELGSEEVLLASAVSPDRGPVVVVLIDRGQG